MSSKKKLTYWLLAIVVFYSYVGAEGKILKNADFEVYDATGKPEGWLVSHGEPEAVSLDSGSVASGQLSLKIMHESIESYSRVSQYIDVAPNSEYVITGRIKTDSVLMGEGAAGARIFIDDDQGSFVANSQAHSGTADWQDIHVEFSSRARSRFRIILYLHKSSGTVWFDNLMVKELEKEKGEQLKFSGGLYSKVHYSSEYGMKTRNYLRAYGKVDVGSADFYLYSCYESSNIGFDDQGPREFYPWINNLAVRFKGPLHPSLKSSTVILGKPRIYYSPYLGVINYDYSVSGQGIAVESIPLNRISLNGFVIWEPDNTKQYRFMGKGLDIKGNNGPWRGNIIITRYLIGDPEVNVNGEIIALGSYEVAESDMLLQVERRFTEGVKLGALQVWQRKYPLVQEIKKATKLDLELPIKRFELKMSHYNFDPGFAPRYRDKTPKFTSETLSLSSWNPVERYANKNGISAALSGSLKGRSMQMEINHYYLKPKCINSYSSLVCNLKGRTSFDFFYARDNMSASPKYLEVSLSHELLKNPEATLLGKATYLQDRTGINNDLKFVGNVKGFELATNIHKMGAWLRIGIQHADELFMYIRGQCTFLGNIQLMFDFRAPRIFITHDEYWLDDFNRLHYRDNYFSLTYNAYF